jgi:hypothetical protein
LHVAYRPSSLAKLRIARAAEKIDDAVTPVATIRLAQMPGEGMNRRPCTKLLLALVASPAAA